MCIKTSTLGWNNVNSPWEPSEGKSSALEIPKDVSRELSQNDVYLLTHLHSFQTQKLKGLERFISRFYGVNPEGS